MWDRGYILYPNDVTQQAGGKQRDPLFAIPLLPFQDALKGLTHQAHRQHLRLIPWFEYGLIIPASSPIAQAHPDWLTTNQSGEFVTKLNGSLYNDGYAYLNQTVPVGIGLYTGPFLGARSLDHITQQVEAVKAAGYRGVSFFCWETTLWFFKGSPVHAIRNSFQTLFPL